MHLTCFSVCLVPFLKAGWLGVTLSLWTSPLDPVAISNQLREVAPPLLRPIAAISPCACAHACEWAGVLSHLGVSSNLDVLIKLSDRKMAVSVRVDCSMKCRLTITHLPSILFNRVRTNVPGRDFISTPTEEIRIAGWTQNCTAEGSSQPNIINRCWLGPLSTFVLHGKQQPPFFCVAGNQYSI